MSAKGPVEPRPAATIALVRDREGQAEVFLVKRHARSGFMANAYVFPGGRVDPADGSGALLERLGSGVERQTGLMEDMSDAVSAAAHVVAAVRETFEESGLLLANDREGLPVSPQGSWRESLNAGERSFESIVVDEGLTLNVQALEYFAHWVTPYFEARRFAARFFIAIAPEAQVGTHDGQETTHSLWITPSEALERHQSGCLHLAPPQWQVLRDLAKHRSTEAILAWARGLDRVPAIQPHPFQLDGALALALPGDPEHPDTPSLDASAPRRIVLRDGTWHDA